MEELRWDNEGQSMWRGVLNVGAPLCSQNLTVGFEGGPWAPQTSSLAAPVLPTSLSYSLSLRLNYFCQLGHGYLLKKLPPNVPASHFCVTQYTRIQSTHHFYIVF